MIEITPIEILIFIIGCIISFLFGRQIAWTEGFIEGVRIGRLQHQNEIEELEEEIRQLVEQNG